jgi:hypothetical protein
MLISYKLGQDSIILRVKIPDSSKTDNSGVIGLTSSTSGLSIATAADNEATSTTYSGSNLETITTLGTYAAPTSGKCRFKEFDSTNHPGIYEIQIADARFSVSNSKSILITIKAITASNVAQVDVLIPLVQLDPYNLYDGYSLPQLIALIAAATIAKCSGLPTSPATIRSVNDTANRIVTAFDSNNNRTSVTITPP